MRKKHILIGFVSAVVIAVGGYLAYMHWISQDAASREGLLRQLPVTATSVIYVDVAQLRELGVLKNLAPLTASSTEEPEYRTFTKETGFEYERDLNQFAFALETRDMKQTYFAVADGKFDRKKITDYLRKTGTSEQKSGREIFHPASSASGKSLSVTFLADDRIAFTDGGDLSTQIESASQDAGHAEWTQRFERLSGTPAFVLLRQDAAIGSVLSQRAPGGIASPQLAQLLNQLTWVSIAGKPEGSSLRAVIDGECPNDVVMRQLTEFLGGIALLAEAGLNDPKLRQKMDPAEREAYLQVLNSIDVTKLDRGDSKSVRVSLLITPETWSKLSALSEKAIQEGDSKPADSPHSPAKNKIAGAKAPAGRR